MKYIKKFENKKKFGEEIELVSYPEYDNIIVTKDEFEKYSCFAQQAGKAFSGIILLPQSKSRL